MQVPDLDESHGSIGGTHSHTVTVIQGASQAWNTKAVSHQAGIRDGFFFFLKPLRPG